MTVFACANCGLPWPGDDALTSRDLIERAKEELPVCIRAPRRDRWFIDSGVNGHMFVAVKTKREDQ